MEISAGGVNHIDFAHRGGERAWLHIEKIFSRRDLVTAWMHIHFVCREAEIAHGEFEIRVGFVNQRFQPAVVLLPIRETTPDNGNVIPLFQFNLSRGGRVEGSQKKQ